MKIKAIPTLYKNIVFKSRLEAAYAKLFDKYNIKWKYEPKSFDLTEFNTYNRERYFTLYYTPDFLLNDKIWFEVKRKRSNGNIFKLNNKEMRFILLHSDIYVGISFYPKEEPEFIYFTNIHKKSKHYNPNKDITFEKTLTISFKNFIMLVNNKPTEIQHVLLRKE